MAGEGTHQKTRYHSDLILTKADMAIALFTLSSGVFLS